MDRNIEFVVDNEWEEKTREKEKTRKSHYTLDPILQQTDADICVFHNIVILQSHENQWQYPIYYLLASIYM